MGQLKDASLTDPSKRSGGQARTQMSCEGIGENHFDQFEVCVNLPASTSTLSRPPLPDEGVCARVKGKSRLTLLLQSSLLLLQPRQRPRSKPPPRRRFARGQQLFGYWQNDRVRALSRVWLSHNRSATNLVREIEDAVQSLSDRELHTDMQLT